MFGSIGYFAVALQWLWALLTIGYPLITMAMQLSERQQASAPVTTTAFDLPPVISLIIVSVVTLAVVAMILAVVFLGPKAVSIKTATITHVAAAKIIPVVAGHKKLTPKKRRRLTVRTLLGIKAALIALPLGAAYALHGNSPLEFFVTVAAAWFFAAGPIVWFALQYGIAWLQRSDLSKLR